MEIKNPLKMNDWNIKELFKFILFLQVILWIISGLYLIGINIPLLRPLIGLTCILFVNGILMLRIFRIHKIGNIETVLYSVGLSIALLMFLGVIVNIFYPIIGVSHPLSVIPLMITQTILTIFLCVLTYLKDKNYNEYTPYINIDGMMLSILFLSLIPFLAIFGAYTLNYYNNNIFALLMVILVGTLPILIAFDKIPKKLYPLALFISSLSLLYSYSLISSYITGWDINYEYYFTNLVVNNSYWDVWIPDRLNAMLSLVMMVPILFNVTGMSVAGIFKLVYPLIFALTPVGLYKIFKDQTNSKIGFLSSFLFISIYMFFLDMPWLARQEIAELFLVLLVMLMVERGINSNNKLLLSVIFIISLIVSHYSLDYIYFSLLLGVIVIVSIRNSFELNKHPFLSSLTVKIPGIHSFLQEKNENQGLVLKYYIIQLTLIFFVTLIYYKFVSSSELFNLTSLTLKSVFSNMFTYLIDPNTIQATHIVNSSKSFLRIIALCLQIVIQFFIGIGILLLLFKRTNVKFKDDFSIFSFLSLVLLISLLVVPFLASSLNTDRFYQIALIFLSPFFVVGGIGFFRILNKIFRYKWTKKQIYNFSVKIISIFLVISLFFNSGFVYEVLGDKSSSMALSNTLDGPKLDEMEYTNAKWLNEMRSPKQMVYSDQYRHIMLMSFNTTNYDKILGTNLTMEKGSYLYLGTFNINNGKLSICTGLNPNANYFDYKNVLNGKSKIYDDKGSQTFQ